jgi:hypothetical protein
MLLLGVQRQSTSEGWALSFEGNSTSFAIRYALAVGSIPSTNWTGESAAHTPSTSCRASPAAALGHAMPDSPLWASKSRTAMHMLTGAVWMRASGATITTNAMLATLNRSPTNFANQFM